MNTRQFACEICSVRFNARTNTWMFLFLIMANSKHHEVCMWSYCSSVQCKRLHGSMFFSKIVLAYFYPLHARSFMSTCDLNLFINMHHAHVNKRLIIVNVLHLAMYSFLAPFWRSYPSAKSSISVNVHT